MENNTGIGDHRKMEIIGEEDTKCGICGYEPKWLQVLTSKKTFVVVYALAGMQLYIVESYFIGTMSTIEKNFRFSSQESGIINGAWDFGGLFSNIAITYVASKGHRTRWVALGMLFAGISSFLRVIPYLLFGPGQNIEILAIEFGYMNTNNTESNTTHGNFSGFNAQGTRAGCDLEGENTGEISFFMFVVAQMILGIGAALYWTCGATYLDDNVRKNIIPALLSLVQVIRLFGPTVGFLLSSKLLKLYINPSLIPNITTDDPRWIGAWWIGWYIIGTTCLLLAVSLAFFPRSLPRAAARRKNHTKLSQYDSKTLSIADFKAAISRILSNKIIVFNAFSTVCFTLGHLAQWSFLPKYLESQFRLSASNANFISGTVGVLSNALGVLTAGIVTSKFKPHPRLLVGWTVMAELIELIGYIFYTFLGCEEQTYHGHWDNEHRWNLTETCNVNFSCGKETPFTPVCDTTTGLAYYSPCHAGCTSASFLNNTLQYTGCACVPNSGKVLDGLCPTDCFFNTLLFIIVMAAANFISATGRTANTLLQFRAAKEEDKSLTIGITESLLGLLAYMPAPLIYGSIMDWACFLWGDDCGEPGNCWIYNTYRLRLAFNLTAAAFLLVAASLDCFVCYYAKDLKVYDEDFDGEEQNSEGEGMEKIIRKEKISVDNAQIIAPMITNPII